MKPRAHDEESSLRATVLLHDAGRAATHVAAVPAVTMILYSVWSPDDVPDDCGGGLNVQILSFICIFLASVSRSIAAVLAFYLQLSSI